VQGGCEKPSNDNPPRDSIGERADALSLQDASDIERTRYLKLIDFQLRKESNARNAQN
jgi:hypothetical protein